MIGRSYQSISHLVCKACICALFLYLKAGNVNSLRYDHLLEWTHTPLQRDTGYTPSSCIKERDLPVTRHQDSKVQSKYHKRLSINRNSRWPKLSILPCWKALPNKDKPLPIFFLRLWRHEAWQSWKTMAFQVTLLLNSSNVYVLLALGK